MKDLESKLSEDLSDFKAIDSLLQDVNNTLQRNHKRTERSLNHQVPQTKSMLEDSMDTLRELAETLPTTQDRISDIRGAYDSGRAKAQSLVSDLTWLNTEFYERWRTIIFTPSSPVSWRWKAYMRSVFVISFVVCFWLFWIAVSGAYRAHRHRLVWGEKLMSWKCCSQGALTSEIVCIFLRPPNFRIPLLSSFSHLALSLYFAHPACCSYFMYHYGFI